MLRMCEQPGRDRGVRCAVYRGYCGPVSRAHATWCSKAKKGDQRRAWDSNNITGQLFPPVRIELPRWRRAKAAACS
eukprot:1538271-Pleurochrysis_carterae.AAC.1